MHASKGWLIRTVLIGLTLFIFTLSTSAIIGPGPTSAIINGTSVELHSSVNPEGADVSVFYEATSFSTSPEPVGSGTTEVDFTKTISDLGPSRSYHVVRAVALVGETRYEGPYTMFFIPGDALQLADGHFLQTAQGSDALFPTDDFSFEFWFKPSGPGVLLREIDSSDPTLWNHVLAEVLPDGVVTAGLPGLNPAAVGTVAFNTWNHLTLTYDDSAHQFATYLNGKPGQTSSGDRQSPREAGRVAFYSFGQGGSSELGAGNPFAGAIDEIRLWNRPLTAAHIATLYNRFGLSYLEAGHVATWTLDLFNGYDSTSEGAVARILTYLPKTGPVPAITADTPMTPDQRAGFQPFPRGNPAGPGAARILAVLVPNHWGADYQFEYEQNGRTLRTPLHSLSAVNSYVFDGETITGFDVGSVYNFRFITRNSFGELISADQSFMAADWAGYALAFSGDDSVETSSFTTANHSITVELWIKPSEPGVVASFGGQSIIEVIPSGSVTVTLPGLGASDLGPVSYNEWHHVVLRYDYSARLMDGFLDGIKSAGVVGDRAPNPGSLYIFGRATKTGTAFKGQMDEIRVWHTTRSDADLTVNRWNLLLGDEAGLYLDWRLDLRSGTLVPDLPGPAGLRMPITGRIYGTPAFVLSGAPLSFGARQADGPNVYELQFLAEPNTVAQLQSSSDLKEWTTQEQYTVPASGLLRIPQQQISSTGAQFFRLIQTVSAP